MRLHTRCQVRHVSTMHESAQKQQSARLRFFRPKHEASIGEIMPSRFKNKGLKQIGGYHIHNDSDADQQIAHQARRSKVRHVQPSLTFW